LAASASRYNSAASRTSRSNLAPSSASDVVLAATIRLHLIEILRIGFDSPD
jgi:hypothetical protein